MNFSKFLTREVNGIENIPKGKPVILCPNHSSFIDGPLVWTVITRQTGHTVHPYVAHRFYDSWICRNTLERSSCIKIYIKEDLNGEAYDNKPSFDLAHKYLKKGGAVLIFPEGKRSHNGKLQEGKVGAAHLAIETKTPVIPIGLVGLYDILPRGSYIPRMHKRCTVNIGKPIQPPSKLDDKHKFTKQIMKEIAKLANKEHEL